MNDFFNVSIDDNICIVSLSRGPVNALSFNFLSELNSLFIDLEQDNNIRVVIIKSELPHFSAGADLKEKKIMSKSEAGEALDNFNNCFNTIENFTKPTICCIQGFCLGGGAELALSCDIRVGTNDATIGFPEVSIGIIPGAGGTQRLPRIIGLSNAKYWIYTAKKFSGIEANKFGFLNFLEADYSLVLKKAINIAEDFISNAPIAVSSSKKAINSGFNKSVKDGLSIERDAYNISLKSVDRDEALSAFIEKRKPVWRNK